jgi:hypothetical protein
MHFSNMQGGLSRLVFVFGMGGWQGCGKGREEGSELGGRDKDR